MEHFVELVKALAWPIAVVWLGFLFRSELRLLLGRMEKFKYKDAEAHFEIGLRKAEESAKDIPEVNVINDSSLSNQHNQLLRISEISPRAAVVEAWTLVEKATIHSKLMGETPVARISPKMVSEQLRKSGLVSEKTIEFVENLRDVRNQATHMPDFAISQEEAERYLELAVRVSMVIESTKS